MNKSLIIPDINIAMASIAISIQTPPSTTTLVLSEIIRLSDNGIILHPSQISSEVCTNLKISYENYRAALSKLTKLKLITRDQGILILSPIIKTPFTSITLKQ